MDTESQLTRLLNASANGAAVSTDEILPLVYEELRQLACRKMSREAANHTLQPTALVHEAYVRLIGDNQAAGWDNRRHFYAAAAEAMRRILVEAARRRDSLKRGAGLQRQELQPEIAEALPEDVVSLLTLDDALDKLAAADPQAADLVKLRFFAGLTIDEAAGVLKVSPRTAKRDWAFARAWLQREIEAE